MGVKLSVGKSGENPYDDLRFHEVHGRNVQLQMSNEFARRAGGLEDGVCFGSRPVRKGERVSLTVRAMLRLSFVSSAVADSAL